MTEVTRILSAIEQGAHGTLPMGRTPIYDTRFARATTSEPSERRLRSCVDETLTLLLARKRPKLASEAGRSFFDEELAQLLFVTPDQVRRAWILFQRMHAANWSFTDCTSKTVMDKLNVGSAVAYDEHFRQFGKIVIRP